MTSNVNTRITDKRTINGLQNTTQNTNDCKNPTKTGGELMCIGKVSSFSSVIDTRHVTERWLS